MIEIILAVICSVLALVSLALQRLYSAVPAHELKRLSGHGDQLAHSLYRPVAYGPSLRLLLWCITTVSFAASFVLLSLTLPAWAAALAVAVVLTVAFVPVSSLRLTPRAVLFAGWASPVLTWVLAHTHALVAPVARLLSRHRDPIPHSRIYEKEDLLALFQQQKEQSDNRIAQDDLELASRALAFDERQAADIVVPRSQTLLVSADDALGPILLDQLHKSGQATFLVYKDTPENVIGSLTLHDAITAKTGGRIMDLVHSDLCYVHEDFSLREILAAFQQTARTVVVVVNSFEELIGTITLEGLLGELFGEKPGAGRITYDDRASVASRSSRQQAAAADDTPVPETVPIEEPFPETPEVVE